MDEALNGRLSYFDMKYKYTPQQPVNWSKYQLLQDGYICDNPDKAVEKSYLTSDPLEQVLDNKKELLQSKIEMIIAGIDERRRIKKSNIERIDTDYCDVVTMIMQMHPYRRYGFDRERLTLERMKKDLEGQKRMEEVNYFRDLSFLNKDLINTAIEYISEQQKEKLIGSLRD